MTADGSRGLRRLGVPGKRRISVLIVVGLVAVGMLEGTGAAYHLPVLMLLLALAWWAVATAANRIVGDVGVAALHVPNHCRASAPILIRLTLHNHSRWFPLMFGAVLLRIASPEKVEFETSVRRLAFLGPGGSMVLEWRVTARGRGVHSLTSVSISTRIPGSAWAMQADLPCAAQLIVLPAISELRANAIHLVVGRRMATGRLMGLPVAMEEYIGVRNYRPGDNPRLLHRVLSLRNPEFPAELVIREFEDPSVDDVCLIVDNAPPADPSDLAAYRYRLEKALCFAAAFVRILVAQKLKSRVVVPGHAALGSGGLRIQGDGAIGRLERELSSVTLAGDEQAIDLAIYQEARFGNAAVLFVSLREIPVEARNRRLAVLTVLPDTVHALTWRVDCT